MPAANDYYLLFINSTHGGMYGISPRFTILDAGASVNSSASASSAVAQATTLTVSGAPNPTVGFVQTFAAISGALPRRFDTSAVAGMAAAAGAALVGAVLTTL